MADSSTPGYLAPTSASPYDATLEDVLQSVIAGITGITGSLIRPRWQPEPPIQPDFGTDWVAYGITIIKPDAYAFENLGVGTEAIERDEVITVLHSFYGPNCFSNCELYRDSLDIGQNRDVLLTNGIALTEVGDSTQLPALLKERWVKRVDVTVTFRRRTSRAFPILTIQSSGSTGPSTLYVDGNNPTTFSFDGSTIPKPPAIACNFSANPLTGVAVLTVSFLDLSKGQPTNWFWEFGDGNTSDQQNPTHSYVLPGVYSVKLLASRPGSGQQTIKSSYIVVASSTPVFSILTEDGFRVLTEAGTIVLLE